MEKWAHQKEQPWFWDKLRHCSYRKPFAKNMTTHFQFRLQSRLTEHGITSTSSELLHEPTRLSPRQWHLHQGSKRLHQQLPCCWNSACIAKAALHHVYIKGGIQIKKKSQSCQRTEGNSPVNWLEVANSLATIAKHTTEHSIMKIPPPSTHPEKQNR